MKAHVDSTNRVWIEAGEFKIRIERPFLNCLADRSQTRRAFALAEKIVETVGEES